MKMTIGKRTEAPIALIIFCNDSKNASIFLLLPKLIQFNRGWRLGFDKVDS
jgi:hypothetical protein